MNVRLSNGTKLFISQPMIGRTTEEILKEYREVVDWCEEMERHLQYFLILKKGQCIRK